MEKICRIKLKDIVDFKKHPFLVNNDESLEWFQGIEEKKH